MRQYAILRLLVAGFLLYIAWPVIPQMATNIEVVFWGLWLGLFMLFTGGNTATLLQMTRPPAMEQQRAREH